jgi:hypothetical protein
MHWTRLLENRQIPADARVVTDLACIGCGYNLYGCAAGARCPECGLEVAESLYIIRKPNEAAAGLRSIARSYIGFVGLLAGLGVLVLGTASLYVAAGVLLAFAVLRLAGALELRLRANLENIPIIGQRLRQLALTTVFETAASASLLVALVLVLGGAITDPATGKSVLGLAVLTWIGATCAVALLAGLLGSPLSDLLGYEFVDREFRWQRRVMAAGVGLAFLVFMGHLACGAIGAPRAAVMLRLAAVIVLLIAWTISWLFLVVGLLHLATAVERERDQHDEVLDVDLDDEIRPPVRPAAPELPDIELK